jgi:pyrimidine-nucleoside phosphorylase
MPNLTPIEIIRRKRDGAALSPEIITDFIDGYVRGVTPDYQAAAFLMAAFVRGLDADETAALTLAMLHSGTVLDFSDIPGVKTDKHSTGGVGDKTSLVLAPLAAAAGVPVPMISGRGLGHTGGTLDKLESIPGFKTNLSLAEFRRLVETVGVGLIGQTPEIAPADKKLYALRDVTGTVESIPLITASIMSKKLAEGVDALVLDVKSGNGAFMKNDADALALARSLTATGEATGKRVVALVTDMNQPLGWAVGNALEVVEAQETLRGNLSGRFAELTLTLAAHMLVLAKVAATAEAARAHAVNLIASGKALEKWREIIVAQGGDPRVADADARLPQAAHTETLRSPQSGFVTAIQTETVGWAALLLGAGRLNLTTPVNPAVGLRLHVELGAEVRAGDALCTLHYDDPNTLSPALERLRTAFAIADAPEPVPPLIHEIAG